MPEVKQGLGQFFRGGSTKSPVPLPPLKPTTTDPYDRGHYAYGPKGEVLGYTPAYAPVARKNYDSLQKSIDEVGSGLWLADAPAIKHIPPVEWALWALDGWLGLQSNVPPPPGAVKK